MFAGHWTTKEDPTLANDNGDLYDEEVFALVDRTIEGLEKMRDIILERTAPAHLAQLEQELWDQESE